MCFFPDAPDPAPPPPPPLPPPTRTADAPAKAGSKRGRTSGKKQRGTSALRRGSNIGGSYTGSGVNLPK